MDRKDALEFLELPEFATQEQIKKRLEDKLVYFDNLSEKAPSDFLRRLHAKNVLRVKGIQKDYQKWEPYVPETEPEPEILPEPEPEILPEPEPEIIPEREPDIVPEPKPEIIPGPRPAAEPIPEVRREPEMKVERQPEPESLIEAEPEVQAESKLQTETEPPIRAEREQVVQPEPVSRPEPVVVEEAAPEEEAVKEKGPEFRPVAGSDAVIAKEGVPDPVGWLIRHTENQSARTFPLFAGKNYLGRKEKPGLVPFITVEEDPYISKVHAVVIAEGVAPYDFYLADSQSDNGDKASKNGTYLNGNDDRISGRVRLGENDTIQIGVTKLIIRYNSVPINTMLVEVEERDYMHTVVIDIQ